MHIPQIQLDDSQIVLSTQEIDLKTDRTNCISREREEGNLRKVGSEEMWFGGEMDGGYCGEGALVVEKGKREECTGTSTGTLPPSHCLGKREGQNIMSFCNNQRCSKAGASEVVRLGCG